MSLTAEFWIGQMSGGDEPVLTAEEIKAFNRHAKEVDPYLADLTKYPESITGEDAERLVRLISTPPDAVYHYRDGSVIEPSDYERYNANLALDRLPERVDVRFALVLERANMRSWPTADRAYRPPGDPRYDPNLDRFQENGLFPGDALAVLHESADGLWCFARSYNYAAWVPRQHLVFGDRDIILGYRQRPEFLVVIGSRSHAIRGDGRDPVELDMGVRLPLMDRESEFVKTLKGRRETHHAVCLPARDATGALVFEGALIRKDDQVQPGFLPYTRANVLRQAFKFLGEHYGWGHSENARDCTGLVTEIFKTMGIQLPRNSWQQGQSAVGHTLRFESGAPEAEKITAVLAADPGDLLYSKGHVMIYLGSLEGEPYVIHDTASAGLVDENGAYNEGEYSGVSVTPLLSLNNAPDTSYLDEMYAIKQIR